MATSGPEVKRRSRRSFLARHRVSLTLCAVVAVVVVEWLRNVAPRRPAEIADPLACMGSMLVVLGVACRSWAAAVLVKGEKLITVGPYACCRHPLYVGSFSILLGYCLLLGEPVGIVLPVATALVTYPSAVLGEERRLAARFPAAWARYASVVPAFLPRRWPCGAGPISFRRWLHNGEHCGAITALLGLPAIEIWHGLQAG
jgi:protein-S-isoprenylcysteine O-methyltransferase Ste14